MGVPQQLRCSEIGVTPWIHTVVFKAQTEILHGSECLSSLTPCWPAWISEYWNPLMQTSLHPHMPPEGLSASQNHSSTETGDTEFVLLGFSACVGVDCNKLVSWSSHDWSQLMMITMILVSTPDVQAAYNLSNGEEKLEVKHVFHIYLCFAPTTIHAS